MLALGSNLVKGGAKSQSRGLGSSSVRGIYSMAQGYECGGFCKA